MDKCWFTTCDGYTIGIIRDNKGGYRIGVGTGQNEREDTIRILELGDKFYPLLFAEKEQK